MPDGRLQKMPVGAAPGAGNRKKETPGGLQGKIADNKSGETKDCKDWLKNPSSHRAKAIPTTRVSEYGARRPFWLQVTLS